MKSRSANWFRTLKTWGLPLLAALTVRWGVAEAYVIPSGSMEPTLQITDRIFVNKLAYGVRVPFTKKWLAHFAEPVRGEVVVFRYPKDESIFFIKRVIGTGGDTIECDSSGRLLVNGVYLSENGYETKFGGTFGSREFGPVVVPDGQLFVMGDNRDNSSDSRVWGFLPVENVLGRAERVWWGAIR